MKRNNMGIPIVSIGLPVYNGQRYLKKTIDSILRQDYKDYELIVSDNASEDATEDICRSYAKKDDRIRYHRFPRNMGAARNFNHVFRLSRGKYFKWSAYDDLCHSAFLSRCVEFLDNAADPVVMVYPGAELIDEEGEPILAGLDRIASADPRPHRRLARVLWSLNLCDPVFGLIKSEYLRRTGLIGPFFGADYVLLGELAMLGEIGELDEILFRLRAHPQRSVQANPTARACAAWYDPSAVKKLFILPTWEQMVWGMLKAVRHSPLPPAEKAKCYLSVPGVHYWRRFRNAGGRVKFRIRESIHGYL
jgi:glycosyltransferase involved in cell wall biosynthesis